MKIAAGIAGILLGLFSLLYVGVYGSMIGSAASMLGAIPFPGNNAGAWGESVKLLSWLAPLVTLAGGIVTFSNPQVGGTLLAIGAGLHWYLLGFGQAGKLTVLPIGISALLAFMSASNEESQPSTPSQTASPPSSTDQPVVTPSTTVSATGVAYDKAKWDALVQFDDDIAAVTKRIAPLGEPWISQFAASYLTLNDKQYITSIEQKITAAAERAIAENAAAEKAAAEKAIARAEAEKARIEAEQEAQALERERIEKQRLAANESLRKLYFGTPVRKIVTSTFIAGIVVVIGVFAWPYRYEDAFAYCEAVKDSDDPHADKRYTGNRPPAIVGGGRYSLPVFWRCMNGKLLACADGTTGRRCKMVRELVIPVPVNTISQYCLKNKDLKDLPSSVDARNEWACSNAQPIPRKWADLDERGFLPDAWQQVSTEGWKPPIAKPDENGSSKKISSHKIDFIHNGITIPDPSNAGNYILAGDRPGPCSPAQSAECRIGQPGKFSIYYFSTNKFFNIWIGEPLAQSRETAQEFLMKTLGITETEMCGLNYSVSTTVYDDYDYAGKDLRFSFCPGAASLPSEPSNRHAEPRAG